MDFMEPFKKFTLLKEEKTIATSDTPLTNNLIKNMSKKLTQTFNGDKSKQVETILKILYAIRDDGQFYFFEYGKDLIERYLEDNLKECKEEIKHMKVLIDNKNALIDTNEKHEK